MASSHSVMVIHDLNLAQSPGAVWPLETKPPLVVDTDTVLALAVPSQGLQTITWKATQGLQVLSGFQSIEAFFRLHSKIFERRNGVALAKCSGLHVAKSEEAISNYPKRAHYFKRNVAILG